MIKIFKKKILYLYSIIMLVVILAAYMVLSIFITVGKSGDVYIPPNTSLTTVQKKLQNKNIIAHPTIFFLSVQCIALAMGPSFFKAGEYNFIAPPTLWKVLTTLHQGSNVSYKITIPEGLTNVGVSKILARDNKLQGPMILPEEGFLWPETYTFHRRTLRQTLIDEMHATMVERLSFFWTKWLIRYTQESVLKSAHDFLVLASIVEREGNPSERRHIAGVFINRLKRGMPLQADATILYAVTQGGISSISGAITKKDLMISSPYNTYLHKGLPPTAIANPSQNSLNALYNYKKTNDLYFVLRPGGGEHVFARTLRQHNKNVRIWRNFLKNRKTDRHE